MLRVSLYPAYNTGEVGQRAETPNLRDPNLAGETECLTEQSMTGVDLQSNPT